MKRHAAHFLLWPELAGSPPNEAIVAALIAQGYTVDLYAPGNNFTVNGYPDTVAGKQVEYGKRWLFEHLFSPSWRKYRIFSGTSEDPMAVVGLLAYIHHRPSFCLADEIRLGSYRGNAPEYWKKLCRWGMRRAKLAIVNDRERIQLLKEYASMSSRSDIIVYPGCFRRPPLPFDKSYLHQRWGFPADGFVIGHSGWFNNQTGADYVVRAISQRKTLYAVLQPMEMEDTSRMLLDHTTGRKRLYIEPTRLSWQKSWQSMAGVDAGVVIYRNPAPQFQHMGTSSNKLCMFIAMGVPVIASRQKSFEFLEDYKCGVLIDTYDDFLKALTFVKKNRVQMKKNTQICMQAYIDPQGRYDTLRQRLAMIA
jgi:glycosyltransferase involved in cell wall biosynthesis